MSFFLGQKIKHLRKNKGLTQFDLEKRTGIKREYLSKIENDELNNPTFSTLIKICDGIGIPLTELLSNKDELPSRKEPQIRVFSSTGESKEVSSRLERGDFRAVPIISEGFAIGNPKYISQNDILDYVVINANYLESDANQHRYRCICVKPDDFDMYPIIEPGAIVCIDSHQRDPKAIDRSLVAFKNNGGTCAIRYLRLESNYLLGMPENIKDYSPLVVSANKENRILGKVIWYQSAKTHSC